MGLQRNLYPERAHDNACTKVVGKFVTNDTDSPATVICKGVDSVTRTGVGVFTLTLPGKGSVNVLSVSTGGEHAGVSVSVNSATRVATVTIFGYDGAAADTDGKYVYFVFTLKNSSTRS